MEAIFTTDAWIAFMELIVIGGVATGIGCYSDKKMKEAKRDKVR